jgi:hypothetical protein
MVGVGGMGEMVAATSAWAVASAAVGGGGISPGSLFPPHAATNSKTINSGNDARFQNMMFTLE